MLAAMPPFTMLTLAVVNGTTYASSYGPDCLNSSAS